MNQPTQFQVPQTVPNAPQAVNPLGYVAQEDQLNQNNRFNNQANAIKLGDALRQYQQQKIANTLGGVSAISELYAAGGPRAVQQYAPMLNKVSGSNVIDSSPQNVPQNQQQPTQAVSNQSFPTQDQNSFQPSQAIQASIDIGHPDFTGHLNKIRDLQNQMAGFANQGKYGATQTDQITKQLGAEKNAMDAEALPVQYEKNKAELINAQNQIPMEQKKAISGEISKQGQSSEQIGQIRQLYSDLTDALAQNKPGISSNLSGKLNQATGGRIGSASAANVLNASNPLATALNTELSRRFNSGEVQLLSNSLIPQPMDTAEYAKQKMTRLNNMITAMESGNEQNVKNVANAITGGNINTTIMPTRSQPISSGQSPDSGLHFQAIQWAQANPKDPRAAAILKKAHASLGAQ